MRFEQNRIQCTAVEDIVSEIVSNSLTLPLYETISGTIQIQYPIHGEISRRVSLPDFLS